MAIRLRDVKVILLEPRVMGEEIHKEIVVVNSRLIVISGIVNTRAGGVGESDSCRSLHCRLIYGYCTQNKMTLILL